MHDALNAIRRLYGEPGAEAPPDGDAELKALSELKAALDRLPSRRPDPSVIDAVVAAAGKMGGAALGPIRAIYDEGPADLSSDEADAEARALAEVKAALEALPPQHPAPSLIDAVVAAAGEAAGAALGPIRTVYGEEPVPPVSEPVSEDAEAEVVALSEMKTALDRLPSRRPDAAVIDAVVAAAGPSPARPATVAAPTGRAADRPARHITRRRVAVALSAVFAVVLVFSGGLWLNQEAPNPQEQEIAVADRAEAEEPLADESVADGQVAEAAPPSAGQAEALSAPPPATSPETAPAAPSAATGQLAAASRNRSADQSGAPSSVRRTEPDVTPDAVVASDAIESVAAEFFATRAASPVAGMPAAAMTIEALRRADAEALSLDDDELRMLYLRLREMQAAQSGLGWDTPPVSLGATPDSIPAPPATGWMQVRVQR